MPKSSYLATCSCGSSVGQGSSAGGLCLRWKQDLDPSTSAFRRLENRARSLAVSNRLRVRVGFLNKNQPSPTETPPTNFPLGWRGDDGFSHLPSGPFPNPKWGGGTESGRGCPGTPRFTRVDPRALSPAGSTRASPEPRRHLSPLLVTSPHALIPHPGVSATARSFFCALRGRSADGLRVGFLILCVGTLTVHVWILLACLRGFYDRKGGHFNELLRTQEQEWKEIFNGALINNKTHRFKCCKQ